jgi:Mn2+/Fe2+ NRAMP family transporter
MAVSNLIAIAIIMTTAATLHSSGKTNIDSSSQAAEALKPVAGAFAELIFALGIIGTGLLAIPVLAGSTAYAIGEGRKWPVGLSRKPKEAMAFYGMLALSVALGVALNFTAIDPIKALYWSAVINGVLAAPVMIIMMLLVRRKSVMDWLGWISTAAMGLCIVGMAMSMWRLNGTSCASTISLSFGAPMTSNSLWMDIDVLPAVSPLPERSEWQILIRRRLVLGVCEPRCCVERKRKAR